MTDKLFCSECGKLIPPDSDTCPYCLTLVVDNLTDEDLKKGIVLFDKHLDCTDCCNKAAARGSTLALIMIGRYLSTKKDYYNAYEYFNKALQQGDKRALNYIGRLYMTGVLGEDNRDKAYSCFFEFRKYYPKNWQAFQGLSYCYNKGAGIYCDLNKAMEYCEKAMEILPDSTFLMVSYADILEKMNNSQCVQWYQKAFGLGNCDAGLYLGSLYEDGNLVEKDLDRAINIYEKTIALAKNKKINDPEFLDMLQEDIYLCQNKKNLELAKAQQDRINQLLELGRSYIKSGNYQTAANMFYAVLKIDSSIIEARFSLAYLDCIDVNYSNLEIVIKKINNAAHYSLDQIIEQSSDRKYNYYVCSKIVDYTTELSISIQDVLSFRFKELIAQLSYNRIGAKSFLINTMLPRLREMAFLLYWMGDTIERFYLSGTIFPSSNAEYACKKSWLIGNLLMKHCADIGSFSEKINYNNKVAFYKQKANKYK